MDAGQVLNDRYRIERPIGRGGQGSVYLARHLMLDGQVAIKELVLHGADPARQASVLRQFTAEARTLSQLRHPSLPRVQDFFAVDDCRYYLVMDLIDGETLKQRLNRLGPQPPDLVLAWGRMLCDVLRYLHGHTPQVILRDLKPENVMIEATGQVKVIDFGIAKLLDPASNQLDTGTQARGAGTPGYAAIEQYSVGTDARTDIYALGATLYCMLAGKPPPESPMLAARLATVTPIPTIRKDVPPALSDAIDFMLRLVASERPQCIDDVLQLLSPSGLGQVGSAELPTRILEPVAPPMVSSPVSPGPEVAAPRAHVIIQLDTDHGVRRKHAFQHPRVLAALASVGVIMVGGVAIYSLSRPPENVPVSSPSPTVASVSASPPPVAIQPAASPSPVASQPAASPSSLAVSAPTAAGPSVADPWRSQTGTLRIHGAVGTRVTLGNHYVGTVGNNHLLDVDDVEPRQYVLSGDPPNGPSFTMHVTVLPRVLQHVFCPISPMPRQTYRPPAPREAPPIRDETPPLFHPTETPPIRG